MSSVAIEPGSFIATPLNGVAPLTVQFTGSSGRRAVEEVAAWIDFGDGAVDDSIGPGGFCKAHTYVSPGTYKATLAWKTFGPESARFPTTVVGTLEIVVRRPN